jgi:hypothetical protein
MEIGARRKHDGRGFWRIGWIAVVNGEEIRGIKFTTRAEAIAYGMRVADYQRQQIGAKDVETECEGAAQNPPLRRLRSSMGIRSRTDRDR